MANLLQHKLIVGIPGTGKDCLASHTVKQIKSQGIDVTVCVIDIKANPQEQHYYRYADVVFSQNCMDMPNLDFIDYIQDCFEKFSQISGNKILILTETNLILYKFGLFRDARLWLNEKICTYLAIGDSLGAYLWLLAQTFPQQYIHSPLVTNIDFTYIAHPENMAAYEVVSRRFPATSFKISQKNLQIIAGQSPVNLAMYNQIWLPMPRLEI